MTQFNPSGHLIQLKSREGSKDYLPVQWRLVWFRSECPNGTIDTEEVMIDLDREVEEEAFIWNAEKRRSEKVMKQAKGYARFRAVITDGKGGRATGTKSENAASFTDFLEKAETGAIGRALAALGYGTQFAPELDEIPRIVDAPVDPQQHTAGEKKPVVVSPNTELINDQQVNSIKNLCNLLQQSCPPLEGQSFQQGKALIAELAAQYNAAKKVQAQVQASA